MKSIELFQLPKSLEIFSTYFTQDMPPWAWVNNIKNALSSIDFTKMDTKKDIPAGVKIEGDVYIHPTVTLPPYAHIIGPAWIGANTEIRIGCFIRGNVIAGENCVLGNSCEYKNSFLMDNVQTPHYNYLGDSVLGTGAHLGAGVICANLRLDKQNVKVSLPTGRVDTNMRKLGAILGEYAEAGCNAVLQPGSILMKRAIVMSCTPFKGYQPENTIYNPIIESENLER